jgi:hypothetical protein
LSAAARIRSFWSFAGYVLAAALVCIALAWLAARITGAQLLEQAQQQLWRLESGQPLWQWRLRTPRDVIAGRAFGNAMVKRDNGAIRITSEDGTPFEVGFPIAWSLDLKHWPILQMELQSSAAGELGLVWEDSQGHTCLAPIAHALTTDTNRVRIDLRSLDWKSAGADGCTELGIARMLRLRIQIPRHMSLLVASAELLSGAPLPDSQAVDLQSTGQNLDQLSTRGAAPLFRLPAGASAESMLALRDRLRARWPAALVVPAGVTPRPQPAAASYVQAMWLGCIGYLLALAWLVWRPAYGRLRPWIDIAGCLLGPLWLIMGLHWGMRPSALGMLAFAGGLAYAVAIERRHFSRLWRWPTAGRDWLWPLAMLPVTALLIAFYGHALHALPPAHVLAYFAWAWLQQWLMLVVLLPRFEQTLHRSGWAAFAAALMFALLHTPNGTLMQLCFVGELWWAACFLRSRCVIPIAVAHATCALLAESGLVSGEWLRSLEVSARFFL